MRDQPSLSQIWLPLFLVFTLLWCETRVMAAPAASRADEAVDATPADSGEVQPRVTADVATSLYVRSDSDGTTVVAPRIRFRQDLGATALDLSYSADAWTSASVDIRTAATPVVREWRDELGVAVEHERGAWIVGASYRYSQEVDYLAHGPTLRAGWEGLQHNLRVELRTSASFDRVTRAGDLGFIRKHQSLSTWLAATQVLGRSTLLQLAGEHRGSWGYQASPYRWVGLGGPVRCTAQTPLCVPEVTPDIRHRFAAAARLRQGLGATLSLGFGYRYYVDTWLLQSHTASADLRARPHPELLLALEYRVYFQGSAYFYSSAYTGTPRYVTRDRELSSMYDHGLAAQLSWDHSFEGRSLSLGLGLHLEGIFYGYDDFPGLERVLAGQGTCNLRIGFT